MEQLLVVKAGDMRLLVAVLRLLSTHPFPCLALSRSNIPHSFSLRFSPVSQILYGKIHFEMDTNSCCNVLYGTPLATIDGLSDTILY